MSAFLAQHQFQHQHRQQQHHQGQYQHQQHFQYQDGISHHAIDSEQYFPPPVSASAPRSIYADSTSISTAPAPGPTSPYDSYFPPVFTNPTPKYHSRFTGSGSASAPPPSLGPVVSVGANTGPEAHDRAANGNVNIDDLVYRYSAESDRGDPFRFIAPDQRAIADRQSHFRRLQEQQGYTTDSGYYHPQRQNQNNHAIDPISAPLPPRNQSQSYNNHIRPNHIDLDFQPPFLAWQAPNSSSGGGGRGSEWDTGTPTEGIYAQDGLWDDESETHTARPTTSGTGGSSVTRSSTVASSAGKGESSSSRRGRSRSGTVSTSAGGHHSHSPAPSSPVPPTPTHPAISATATATGTGISGAGAVTGLTPIGSLAPALASAVSPLHKKGGKDKEKDRPIAEEKHRMWAWRRPSMANLSAHANGNGNAPAQVQPPPLPPLPTTPGPEETAKKEDSKLEKKKSKSKLRIKSKKSEVGLYTAAATGSASPDVPLPSMPDTPSSFLTTGTTATPQTQSPSSFLSPPPHHLHDPSSDLASSPLSNTALPAFSTVKAKQPSAWKRSMTKIFRSKSSTTLRESFQHDENACPPLPPLELSVKHPNQTNIKLPPPQQQRVFSASTPPPLGEKKINIRSITSSPSQRFSAWSRSHNHDNTPPAPISGSVPKSSLGSAVHLSSHPSLPLDPFASSLDLESNTLPQSPPSSSSSSRLLGSPLQSVANHNDSFSRPKLPRHSPSLKDLKNLLPGGNKFGSLAKTKSLANLRVVDGKSASCPPPNRQSIIAANKRTSVPPRGLAPKPTTIETAKETAPIPVATPAPEPASAPAPGFTTLFPIESPPLLPPNPPYFPLPTSLNRPSRPAALDIAAAESLSSSISSPLTPPPTTPLPPTPLTGSSSSRQLGVIPLNSSSDSRAPLSRSGSGAVLLPRSRSTSMSLKAPPTSSSFFDLYEQLGIWPTTDKDKEKEKVLVDIGDQAKQAKEKENINVGKAIASDPVVPVEVTSPLLKSRSTGGISTNLLNVAAAASPVSSSPRSTNQEVPTDNNHLTISQSPSERFSASSWEAAINAFPILETDTKFMPTSTGSTSIHASARDPSMDFGLPYVEDPMAMQSSPALSDNRDLEPFYDLSFSAYEAGDASAGSITEEPTEMIPDEQEVVVDSCSASSSYHTARHGSVSTSSGSASQSANVTGGGNQAVRGLGLTSAIRPLRRDTDGSGRSSRESSRSRRSRRSRKEGDWFQQGESSSSSSSGSDGEDGNDSEGEEDDVPLSQLHPQAQAHREQQAALKARRKLEKQSRLNKRVQPALQAGIKVYGRNPGGGEIWDGEGGVPPAVLVRKLEKLSMDLQRRISTQNAISSSSNRVSSSQLPQSHDRSIRPQRSFAGIETISETQPLSTLTRSSTGRRPGSSSRRNDMPPPLPHSTGLSPALPGGHPQLSPVPRSASTMPSPLLEQGIPSSTHTRASAAAERHSGTRSSHGHGEAMYDQTSMSRTATSSSSRRTPQTDLSRASTTKSVRSGHSSNSAPRSREVSNPANTPLTYPSLSPQLPSQPHVAHSHTQVPEAAGVTTRERPTRVRAVLEGAGRTIDFEVYTETNARDLISRAYAKGDIGEVGRDLAWVLYEVFGEIGCERPIREYEPILPILKGWDPACRSNALVFRATNRALPTFARAIPSTAPMHGGFVQHESKKGKWSKRWLETRGGQIFLAKNEKNKDEIQINASFVDIYTMSGAYKAPNTFVFVVKRMNPAVAFENPLEYSHVFASEEGVGYKLLCAVYDAKSFTMAQTQPHLFGQIPTRSTSNASSHHGQQTQAQAQSHPNPNSTLSANPSLNRHQHQYAQHAHGKEVAPLLTVGDAVDRSASAFTGKGLLRI